MSKACSRSDWDNCLFYPSRTSSRERYCSFAFKRGITSAANPRFRDVFSLRNSANFPREKSYHRELQRLLFFTQLAMTANLDRIENYDIQGSPVICPMWQARSAVASWLWPTVRRSIYFRSLLEVLTLAGAVGIEPTTLGFGDRCSTN